MNFVINSRYIPHEQEASSECTHIIAILAWWFLSFSFHTSISHNFKLCQKYDHYCHFLKFIRFRFLDIFHTYNKFCFSRYNCYNQAVSFVYYFCLLCINIIFFRPAKNILLKNVGGCQTVLVLKSTSIASAQWVKNE